ncbi:MAG: hypothetical protein ACKV22_32825 [Bryobacteraceae bacterium]
MRRLRVSVAIGLLTGVLAQSQVCRLSVAGLNRNRRVLGNVNAECPAPIHSAPFGNWGVTSNFGGKINGHQFQGWCQNRRVCDNRGNCFDVCRDGWFEWNSCTDNPDFKAPNCTLYNAKDCTEQESPLGVNVMSTKTVDIPVRCPLDTNGDGQFDRGGCSDVANWSPGENFISLYELDPLSTDDLIQTVYFPETPVKLICNVLGCTAAGSDWAGPIRFADPAQPPRVFAEMAAVVNFGNLVDEKRACPAVPPLFYTVSSATFQAPGAAPESLVSAFGFGLSTSTASASQAPLPFELAGTQVRLTDAAGQEHFAALLYVSPTQVNYLIPKAAAVGLGTVRVLLRGEVVATGALPIDTVAPGIYTANSNGIGAPAALLTRLAPDGSRTVELAYTCGSRPGSCTPAPIVWSRPEEQIYLTLFGTGIRGRVTPVTAKIGLTELTVLYGGAQGQYAGLDQINVLLPRSLAGTFNALLTVTVGGRPSNPVELRF